MKKLTIFICALMTLVFGAVMVIGAVGDPTQFGNATATTVLIGGDAGIGNFTGWVDASQFIGYINASYVNNSPWITQVSADTTPTLGGNLDANSNDITSVNNITFDGDAVNHAISDNSTCIIIQGDTATLEVC